MEWRKFSTTASEKAKISKLTIHAEKLNTVHDDQREVNDLFFHLCLSHGLLITFANLVDPD